MYITFAALTFHIQTTPLSRVTSLITKVEETSTFFFASLDTHLTMPSKSKKRHIHGRESPINPESPRPTTPDRTTWQGWCEVESEPAFFNTILHDIGVRGIKVREVLGLEDYLLALIPKPVYAMIFLLRYSPDGQEANETSCPSNVWFANQVPEYACASVSLLNIVMNVPDLELGKQLQHFKDFTIPFHPVCKGDAIADFDLVRNAHNSFARTNDMLSIDSLLKEKNDKRLKKQKLDAANKAKAIKSSERSAIKAAQDATSLSNPSTDGPAVESTRAQRTRVTKPKQSLEPSLEENAFHFIAYMPIDDELWKLDGMDPFPQSIAKLANGQDWLNVIQNELAAQMMQYQEGQIEFSLMAVVKDPITEDKKQLAENIKSLQELGRRLDRLAPEWLDFIIPYTDEATIFGPDQDYQITNADIESACVAESIAEKLKTDCVELLMQTRQMIITAQAACREAVRESIHADQGDSVKAMHRRFDYSSFVNGWLSVLSEEDALVSLLQKSTK